MAYTYDDFVKAATQAGMLEAFSQEDLDLTAKNPEYGMSMLQLYQDERNATTEEQRLLAQTEASQLRSSYAADAAAKSGIDASAGIGTIGSIIPSTPSTGSTAGSTAATADQTTGSFDQDGEYRKLLQNLVNRESSGYDYKEDPVWKSLKKSYLREGERATADALAEYSAATGGVPSSYAVTAATQAGDYYAAQLNDRIPELYDQEYQKELTALGLLQAERDDAYQREQQALSNALTMYQLGIATPEVLQTLGLAETSDEQGETTASGSGGNIQNGSLTRDQVMQLQDALRVTQDGLYGPESMTAAGGLTAEEAWNLLFGDTPADGSGHPLLDAEEMRYGDPDSITYMDGVANKFQDGKMVVSGRLLSQEEVEELYNSGQIVQQYDPSTGLYRYVWYSQG